MPADTSIQKADSGAIRYLGYHEIVNASAEYLYSATAQQFESHLKLAASLEQSNPDAIKLPGFTFDDGHISNFEIAAPLMNRFGIRGIFFVTSSWIGVRPDTVNWEHLREMARSGHSIQSHTWTHRYLTRCTDAQAREELIRSKREIEDRLGTEVSAVSAPGGRWNSRAARLAAAVGYRQLYHSDGWNPPTDVAGVAVIPRHMVRNTTSAAALQHLLATRGLELAKRRAVQTGKKAVQNLLGDRLYHHLWTVLAKKKGGELQPM